MDIIGRFWIIKDGKNFLGDGRIELLRNIGLTGSISQAAKIMGMSYKAAWDDVDMMNNLADTPLVVKNTGGKKGGGTSLTESGWQLIEDYERIGMIFHEKMLDAQYIYEQFLNRSSVNVFDVDINRYEITADGNTYLEVLLRSGTTLTVSTSAEYLQELSECTGYAVYLPVDKIIVSTHPHIGMDEALPVVLTAARELDSYILLEMSTGCDIFTARLTVKAFERLGLSQGSHAFMMYNQRDIEIKGRF